jgi:hypothetical protein
MLWPDGLEDNFYVQPYNGSAIDNNASLSPAPITQDLSSSKHSDYCVEEKNGESVQSFSNSPFLGHNHFVGKLPPCRVKGVLYFCYQNLSLYFAGRGNIFPILSLNTICRHSCKYGVRKGGGISFRFSIRILSAAIPASID